MHDRQNASPSRILTFVSLWFRRVAWPTALVLMAGCVESTSTYLPPSVFETNQAEVRASRRSFRPGDTLDLLVSYRTRTAGVGHSFVKGGGVAEGARVTILDSPLVNWRNAPTLQGDWYDRPDHFSTGEQVDTFHVILHDRVEYRFSAGAWYDSVLAATGTHMIAVRDWAADSSYSDPLAWAITTGHIPLSLFPR